jgi:hypothetical protein
VCVVKALEPDDPRQAGKYRLLAPLGDGGMGRVFLGRSPGGRLVAVKVIRAELAGDPEFRSRFAREVDTARTVSGIFTAPVVDADLDGPRPWLVTAYVEGPSLARAVADQGPLPAGWVLPLAAGLAEGLGTIHVAGVVHRDLKPANVLLASDGPRIIDFGISRAVGATTLTRAGWVSGSPGFMSPEQAEGGDAGPAADIFSLGAVLMFAATGAGPFGTGPASALLYRVVHSQPATGALPEPLRSLVQGCLAKDPEQRPTTEHILAGLSTATPAAGWLPWPAWSRPDTGLAAPAAGPAVTGVGPTVTAADLAGPVPAEPAPRLAGRPSGRPAGTPATWPADSPADTSATWAATRAAATGLRPRPDPAGRLRAAWPWPGRRPGRRAAAGLAIGGLAIALAAVTGALLISRPAVAPPAQPATGTSARPSAAAGGTSWATYRDPAGFSLRLPPGWAVLSRTGTQIEFTGPPGGFAVVIAWTTHPTASQLTDWQGQAAVKALTDPSYQQIGIQPVSYRGYDAADWEFTDVYQGQPTRVIDRGFIVRPGHLAYAIELYGSAARWHAVFVRMWKSLLSSFQPSA